MKMGIKSIGTRIFEVYWGSECVTDQCIKFCRFLGKIRLNMISTRNREVCERSGSVTGQCFG